MTKDVLLIRIASIVSALEETAGSPESMLYIFCDMNMDDYQTIREILLRMKYITIKSHFVTLTESGKETARKINSAIKDKSNV